MTNQISVYGDTVKTDGDEVFIRPVCDFFKIDYDNQVVRIKNDPILSIQTGKKPFEMLFGDNRPRVFLSKKGFIRWIQLINPKTLPQEMREKFIQYQTGIFDFFYGTAEQESEIRHLISEKNHIDEMLKNLANQKRAIARNLAKALNCRYQYSLNM